MTLIVDADVSPVRTTLERTEREVKQANLAMISAIRQTAQAGILVLQVAGVAIDQVFALYVEVLLTGLELAATISAGSFGLGGVFLAGQIIAMVILIRQIRAKRTAAAQQTNAAVQLLRMGTYR